MTRRVDEVRERFADLFDYLRLDAEEYDVGVGDYELVIGRFVRDVQVGEFLDCGSGWVADEDVRGWVFGLDKATDYRRAHVSRADKPDLLMKCL